MTSLPVTLGKAIQAHCSFMSRKGRSLLEMLMEGAEEKMECSVARGKGGLRGREGTFFLAASVGACEGEVLEFT